MPVESSKGKGVEAAPSAPALMTPLELATTPAPLPARCANCDSPLTGPFCAQCGQHAADYHRSIWRLIVGFFDNVFSWDGKFFRTVGPLLFRPGLLTRDFLLGRRARYVHPLRLFLFTSAVCLTLLQFGHGQLIQTSSGNKNGEVGDRNGLRIDFDDPDNDKKPSPSPSPDPSPAAAPTSPAASPGSSPAPSASPADTPRKPRPRGAADNALERYMEDVGKRVDQKSKQLGPEEFSRAMSSKMQSSLSWVALTMLPLFALLLRSLYWRRDSYYFDHLIYSLHYHSFLLILLTVYRAADGVVGWTHLGWLKIPLAFGLLVPPWYLYRSLKVLFGESRSRTGTKVFVIGAFHVILLVIGMAIVGMTSVLALV